MASASIYICATVAEFVGQCGYRIAVANERSESETILRNTKPALMITDVVLRGGSGLGLV